MNPQQTPNQLLKRAPVFLCRGALSASKYYPSARGYYVASWKVFVEAPAQFAKAWLIGLLLTLLQQLFQCTAVHNVLFLGSIFTSQLNKLRICILIYLLTYVCLSEVNTFLIVVNFKLQICNFPNVHPFSIANMPQCLIYPSVIQRVILDTGASYSTKCTLCTAATAQSRKP